jgi:hypothetical protein
MKTKTKETAAADHCMKPQTEQVEKNAITLHSLPTC